MRVNSALVRASQSSPALMVLQKLESNDGQYSYERKWSERRVKVPNLDPRG